MLSIALAHWAFFAPESLAAFVAFPYQQHLLHDVGTSFHLVSHIIDRDIGGHGYDAPGLAMLVLAWSGWDVCAGRARQG
jgi:hypothetical protein